MNPQPQVVTVTLNPAIDQTVHVEGFQVGEVNRVGAVRQNAGGKGVNVASALADLGLRVVATGFLGRENAGIFEDLFRAKGIDDRFVRLGGSTRLGLKVVDNSCHNVTEINYPGLVPGIPDTEALLAALAGLARPGTWFVLSGSIPPGVPAGIYADMIGAIHERGGRVLLDTSGEPLRLALEKRPDIVKPNQRELEQLTGTVLDGVDDIARAASDLLAQGAGLVAVSMGGRGALFASGEERLLAVPPSVPVQSTVGAGDTMVAGLVLARSMSQNLSDTARLATACGAHAVTRIESGIDLAAIRELQQRVVVDDLRALRA
jgi:1-phosphofructokinase